MGTVIGLSHFVNGRASSAIDILSSRGGANGFTRRDLADLEAWSTAGRRAELCVNDGETFAMLLERDRYWASWGVVRQSGLILVWDCITHQDLDRFPTMTDALASLNCGGAAAAENVISFVGRLQSAPILLVGS